MNYNQFAKVIRLSNGTYAFHFSDIAEIMEFCAQNSYVILGGDILTLDEEYTYDSWFYAPERGLDIVSNVHLSILKCNDYISWYTQKFGSDYLCSLVISDSYSRDFLLQL